MFTLLGDQISGFDEPQSAALTLVADPLGRTVRSTYRNNLFHRCTTLVPKAQQPLWDAARPEGNVCTECGAARRCRKRSETSGQAGLAADEPFVERGTIHSRVQRPPRNTAVGYFKVPQSTGNPLSR